MNKKTPCSEPGCTATHGNNSWARIRAQDAGWFFQKDGTVFCPDHVPAWVEAWRARQKQNKTT